MGPCNFCGFCADYGCINYSKASPQACVIPYLERMKTFELRANSHVLRVDLAPDGKTASGVTYLNATGEEVEQPASMVILAAFHFHNVRLMLSSRIGKPYDPQTGQGVVGRNFCYQTDSEVNTFYDPGIYTNPFIGAGRAG